MQEKITYAGLTGRRQILPLPFGASRLWLPIAFLLCVFSGHPLHAEQTQYAHEITNRLNPTGRTLTLPAPLRDGNQILGEVLLQITPDDAILIDKAGLLERAATLADAAVMAALRAVPAGQSGFAPIEDIARAGFGIRFDTGLQELVLELSADQRPEGELSVTPRRQLRPSTAALTPESVAGYVNITAGVDQLWDTGVPRGSLYDDQPSARLDLDSALRVGEVVIENRAAYEGDVDTLVCPPTAVCSYGHVAGLKRQSSRAVYDLPGHEIRISIGDTDALSVPLQRATDLLGVSVEKSPRKLNPGENITSMGGGSFRLERSAAVEVKVNGAPVQRLDLRPGTYNLRDLPLATGANAIELDIVDETGERRTLSFSSYSDQRILAPGKSEWATSFGVPSYLLDNQRTYAEGDYMGSGFLRYGLSENTTGEIDLQGDAEVIMAGAGVNYGTALGLFGLHGAASTGNPGTGFAADFTWSLVSFSGLFDANFESATISAEYRSSGFHTPGQYLTDASGIIFPEFNYWLRLNGSYSFPLLYDATATIAARYQFDDEERQRLSVNTVTGDRYGADLTISAPVAANATASLMLGYSNELYNRRLEDRTNIDPDFRVAFRLNFRPEDTTMVSTSYDTLGQQATVSAYKSEGSGIGRWDTSIDAQARGYQETGSISASAGYYGNRGDVRVAHYADVDGIDLDAFEGATSRQRTSLRVNSAIAFAGNRIAVGPPVRGGAFAIVTPHDSLSASDITVGSIDSPRARSDAWGNALVPDLPAYLPSSVAVEVDDLPLGYSLGSGAFDTFAPYKAGYVFEVGSANSVSVYGTLLDPHGEPVELLTGTARPASGDAPAVALFTNAEGRFGAEGLAPGHWVVEMAADAGRLQYVFEIPEGANGLVKLGSIAPLEGSAQ